MDINRLAYLLVVWIKIIVLDELLLEVGLLLVHGVPLLHSGILFDHLLWPFEIKRVIWLLHVRISNVLYLLWRLCSVWTVFSPILSYFIAIERVLNDRWIIIAVYGPNSVFEVMTIFLFQLTLKQLCPTDFHLIHNLVDSLSFDVQVNRHFRALVSSFVMCHLSCWLIFSILRSFICFSLLRLRTLTRLLKIRHELQQISSIMVSQHFIQFLRLGWLALIPDRSSEYVWVPLSQGQKFHHVKMGFNSIKN